MKRDRLFFLLTTVLTALIVSGCAPSAMYYWGDYSTSLYQAKKIPSDETLLAHKQALENIITTSKSDNLRIPPGVCAELGYIYFRQNNDKLASQYFQMEEDIYPESKILMTRLKQAIALKKKKAASKADETVKASSPAADVKADRFKDGRKPEAQP